MGIERRVVSTKLEPEELEWLDARVAELHPLMEGRSGTMRLMLLVMKRLTAEGSVRWSAGALQDLLRQPRGRVQDAQEMAGSTRRHR